MKHRLAQLVVVVMCVGLLGAVVPAQTAASPIDDKQAQAEQLQREIDANGERISMLAEQYNGAMLHLEEAKRELSRVEAERASAEHSTAVLRSRVAARGAALYMTAGTQTPLSWGDAADVNEAGSRSSYGAIATDRDSRLLDELRAARQDLAVAESRFEKARDAAQRDVDALDGRRREVEAANARQAELLAQVKGELATLIEEEQAREAAAERQRSEAEFARLHLDDGGQRGGLSANVSAEPSATAIPDTPAPSAGAAAAVAYARAQLGKPYRYAAAGPDEFDCSGLTMMAWAQAGVSMPHYSAAQGAMFPRVSDDQLSPGDLVIYYPDEHHVAIYVGGGMTIAATQTGDFIKLQPVFRSGYEYAVRPS
jgi:cell wall-associated NlpC family hydrolase